MLRGWALHALSLKVQKQIVLSTESAGAERKRLCPDLSSLTVTMGKSSNFSEAGLNCGPFSDHPPGPFSLYVQAEGPHSPRSQQ